MGVILVKLRTTAAQLIEEHHMLNRWRLPILLHGASIISQEHSVDGIGLRDACPWPVQYHG
jgi:hypothetical protein